MPAESTVDREDDSVLDQTGGPRTALVVAGVLAVLVALLVAVLATRDSSTERDTQSPLIGRLAPAVAGPTLAGGTFDLDALRGRWVVVNFFATWCVPCIEEHPELIAFDEAHRDAGDAALVSVTFDNDSDDARAFFEQRGGEWPVVDDPENSVGVAYGVARVPESFLVAPDGTVVRRLVGGVTQAQLDGLIEQYESAATEAAS
jgi:cytochrome c biogenesis protein CcmG, thiol:disulfide interchange protein DsbE